VKPIVPDLKPNLSPGASVQPGPTGGWHLEIPAGPAGSYRLAQLDDYTGRPRRHFPWRAPLVLELHARASGKSISGTWGFGFWNDPFSLSLGMGGGVRRTPALPNAAWFFFAAPPNYLSLRDDLPAQGFLAATFRSARLPGSLLMLSSPLLSIALLPPLARPLRRAGRRLVYQEAASITDEVRKWHTYRLEWEEERVAFHVDGQRVLDTRVSPCGPLGLVSWVDNQYVALPPDGRFRYGTLAQKEAAWIELEELRIYRPG